VDYQNATHIEQLRRVFRAANGYRMPIVVHMRVNTGQKLAYGREEAMVFLNELVAAAPDVDIQVAHLAGAGGYEFPFIESVLDVFARLSPGTTPGLPGSGSTSAGPPPPGRRRNGRQ
jgi:uncharacterized protein